MSKEIIKIKCQKCTHEFERPHRTFIPFYDKLIGYPCPQCRSTIEMLVNAKLFTTNEVGYDSKEKAKLKSGPPTEIIQSSQRMNLTKYRIHVLQSEFCKGQIFELQSGENSVGRFSDSMNNVSIRILTQDALMSRNHCIITMDLNNNGFLYSLSDNGSKNGTYINDNKLEKDEIVLITPKDSIRIGKTIMKLDN